MSDCRCGAYDASLQTTDPHFHEKYPGQPILQSIEAECHTDTAGRSSDTYGTGAASLVVK